MKKFLIILSSILYVSFANANSCLEKVTDQNWPDDRHQLVLSCKKTQDLVGSTDFNQICFAITKLQFGNYKDTMFKTIRSRSDEPGGLKTLVVQWADGRVQRDGQVSRKGSVLVISEEKNSFEFNHDWIERTTVDLDDTSKLKFEVYRKKFLRKILSESSLYSCQRIL